ncbi:hypothetical protein [Flavobacterium sp.]
MNLIDFTKNGGYRFKQFTLRKMQEAYFQLLKAFVAFCGVPESGNFIISGCKIDGANITDGYLYIDGELCQFTQIEGTLATKIKKNVVIQSLGFKNGNNENVFRFVDAIVDGSGTALSDFTRISPVFDGNYVHTDNNFTDAFLVHLASIQFGAQVNVIPSWAQTNPAAPNYIEAKPNIIEVLEQQPVIVGDFYNNTSFQVNFPAPIATSDYQVMLSFECASENADNLANSPTYFYVIHDKTTAGFKIRFREVYSAGQNLKVEYLILKRQ